MKIGNVRINGLTALAPMAGVSDRAMRTVCKEQGVSYLVGEMVSAKGMYYGDRKSAALLETGANEHPVAVQLFGSEPHIMADSAVKALRYAPDIIDINMGCPAPKIVGSGGGSALMREPRLAGEVIKAVVNAVPVPVTVKLRAGWDEADKNAVECAKIAQQSGAAALTIHGRTRSQFYAGAVDYDIIHQVVSAVSIPVIGNGDVCDIPSAKRMLATGCQLLMIGRGALGAPWIFGQLEHYFKTGEVLPEPPFSSRMQTLLRQVSLMLAYKGEYLGMREARKHAAWYFKGLRGAAALRKRAGGLCSYSDLLALCDEAVLLARTDSQEAQNEA